MGGGTSTTAGHRSLADQLRSWSDDQVHRLLRDRPDLATPAPHDFGQLASRAAVRGSVARAIDTLTRGEVSVLDALVVAGQTTREELISTVHADASFTTAAIDRLVGLALAWESPEGLRPLSTAVDCLVGGPEAGVSGLRPRTAGGTPAEASARLDVVSPEARVMLDHVLAGGGAATARARRGIRPEDAEGPAEELVAHRLLVPGAGEAFVLPGEVGMALRGGRTTEDPVDEPPAVATTERPADRVASTAAGSAAEFVRRTEVLLEGWGGRPAAALRTGGLGVRELRAVTTLLQVDALEAALVVETASAAGLLASRADAEGDPVWTPTDAYDDWLGASVPDRWATLARAWARSPRLPGLVGRRDADGRSWNALTPELSAAGMPEAKAMVLAELAALPEGEALAAGTGLASLVARIAWLRPRRPRTRAELVAWAVTEAATLGVTGLDALAPHGRALARDEDPAAALAALLPPPVDHVLIQADLTAVAPGPLEPEVARSLQLVADIESQGAATVYRFSPGSVRRALDAGWSAAEVHAFLEVVSRTPVPQPLTYLVDDAVRTFGQVRVGVAASYVVSDDDAALADLLRHSEALGLRRIAPTVVVSTAPADVLLPRLREAGLSPVVEAPDGTVRVGRPEPLRARTPQQRGGAPDAARHEAQVALAVRKVREGDAAARSRPASATTPAGALSALRDAIERRTPVVIGFTDDRGVVGERTVHPLRVDAGRLTARDADADPDDPDAVRTLPIHRVSRVTPA